MTNQRDEMSRFMMGVANLVREECRTVMLYDDMTLSRLIVYDQSIEVSKLKMMSRILKRSGSSHHGQPRFKNRAQTQEESRSANVKLEKGGGSQNGRPTRVTCGKSHYSECRKGTRRCFGCCKEGHKVRDYPIIASRGREGKQVASNVTKDDVQATRHFYALRTRGEKLDGDDDKGKSLNFSFSYLSCF